MSWICCKCNVELEEVDDVQIQFGDMDLPEADGWRCPECGAEYIMKDYAEDQLNTAEEMLQGK